MSDDAHIELKGALDGLSLFPYGVQIITTGGGALEIGAFAASWVMQISFDPPLVALAVDKVSHSHILLEENGNFAINFLDETQGQIAARIATPHTYSPFKLNQYATTEGITGVPILARSLGHVECLITNQHDPEGDHTIFIGQAIDGKLQRRDTVLTLEKSGLRYR